MQSSKAQAGNELWLQETPEERFWVEFAFTFHKANTYDWEVFERINEVILCLTVLFHVWTNPILFPIPPFEGSQILKLAMDVLRSHWNEWMIGKSVWNHICALPRATLDTRLVALPSFKRRASTGSGRWQSDRNPLNELCDCTSLKPLRYDRVIQR